MHFLRFGMVAAAVVITPNFAMAENNMSTSPASAGGPNGWEKIVPRSVTIKGRRFTPTCSDAPGTTPEFSYYYH